MNLTVSAAMELISLENMMSASASTVNSALGKHGEGTTAQGVVLIVLMSSRYVMPPPQKQVYCQQIF
jgi:hypothetical protein